MPSLSSSLLVRDAQTLAQQLLVGDRTRLDHLRGTATVAGMVTGALDMEQRESIVAAAWLHDIGYAPALVRTGFHPVDGALFLAGEGWPDEVVLMVAHHSHAAVMAPYYGVQQHMALLEHAPGSADDVITFSDLRAGRDGLGAEPRDRVEEMRRRHAATSPVPHEVRESRYRMLLTTASRVGAAVNRVTRHQSPIVHRRAHVS